MGVFKDAEEVYKYIGGAWEEAFKNPEVGEKLAGLGAVVRLNYTDPDVKITIDPENKRVIYGETDVQPLIEIFAKADLGNMYWQGKLNLTVAMAKGEVRAKGPVTKLMQMVPTARAVYPFYEDLLKRDGRNDLLV